MTTNEQAPWKNFDAQMYGSNHYEEPSVHDRIIAARVIKTLGHQQRLFDAYHDLIDVGTGGVLRTALLAEPLLQRDERQVRFTDIGESQLATTRLEIGKINSRQPSKWRAHEVAMAQRHASWSGALSRLCRNSIVEELSLFDLQPESADIVTEGHVLCSFTNDKKEHDEGVATFYGALRKGGLAIRLFDINSSGYRVGETEFPGYPETPGSVRTQAQRMGLIVIDSFGLSITDYNKNIHTGITTSTLKGLGSAVVLKPDY